VGTYATEAEAKYHALEAERSGLVRAVESELTLGQWVNEWLSTTGEIMPDHAERL
jgi:hypothetical protein